ncbi:cation:proton antiporter [Flaviaesturariibacter amylovorans]|uniref:Cation:proton antiporter n=1 Tax=Flaviaesturariibacter amylovorans TaxID=1084520 RepID=A0ABP8GK89_9BACT
MNPYILILIVVGLAALGMAWMPAFTKATKISYSILYVALGALIYSTLSGFLPLPDPIAYNKATLRLTEIVVIISLMGSGLKIDRPFSFRNWKVPLRLVSITMLLSIAAVAAVGYYWLGFSPAAALLLGAVLAPTDPVLAADVQVGAPGEGDHTHSKVALTAEAGMNDGTAFPFTWLAVLMATGGLEEKGWTGWLQYELLYKLAAGVLLGWLLGRILGWLFFRLPEMVDGAKVRDGFVALCCTLLVYGITEAAHGYGFIAVFVTAVTLRGVERHHKMHKTLHAFTDQIERLLVCIVLLLFGGSLVAGLLEDLTWPLAGAAISFVLVLRPVIGALSLWGTGMHWKEKLTIGFFGIKGIGSFYYLAFAVMEATFAERGQLWAVTGFTVLLSIIVHGLTATSVMSRMVIKFHDAQLESPPEPAAKA